MFSVQYSSKHIISLEIDQSYTANIALFNKKKLYSINLLVTRQFEMSYIYLFAELSNLTLSTSFISAQRLRPSTQLRIYLRIRFITNTSLHIRDWLRLNRRLLALSTLCVYALWYNFFVFCGFNHSECLLRRLSLAQFDYDETDGEISSMNFDFDPPLFSLNSKVGDEI